ncbi:cell wall binding repeat-containing protein [Clostridium sp. DL-VIII]|uniref:flavodoxin n=1 Tax=Clostridium sp. DL-VIII TaxID=641107 RepID=UPI00023AF21E|nr:flavodoxin [Clostridium sp. DL-VIII]EHI97642.1 cell wall binding repeat-containing protein [Clostridium sp. DL-VIII]
MKKLKRLLASFFTLLILFSIVPIAAHAEWKSNSAGWWYTEGSSWATGWRNIDGNWYYFYSDGYMASDTTIDGYYVNSNGVWISTNNSNKTNDKSQVANVSTSTKTKDGSKKILIAYFSQTGTTEKAAKRIQELTKGDIVQIKTVTPYPDSYQQLTEVAKKEKDDNARPKLATKVENMNDYDAIFIGYPIWWHTAPMAIDTFLESYNLSGKTVVPFCTSSASNIAESMGAINTLCPKSNILEGLRANDIDDIEPWLKKIGVTS